MKERIYASRKRMGALLNIFFTISCSITILEIRIGMGIKNRHEENKTETKENKVSIKQENIWKMEVLKNYMQKWNVKNETLQKYARAGEKWNSKN